MRLVAVTGGFINAAHVVCAIHQEYDTKGFVSVFLTNGDTVVVRKETIRDLPLFRINARTWVNPEHVTSVGLNVDRARMMSEKAHAEEDYVGVEIVLDTPKYRQSFFVDGENKEDLWAWSETLMAVEYATDERLDWIDES